jgi:hypothetical protein
MYINPVARWRIISVFIGASSASWLLALHLQPLTIGILAGCALIVASATHKSQRYITPTFSTFLVFWLLWYTEPTTANITFRFDERILETIIDVGSAYLFAIAIPKVVTPVKQGSPRP